MVQLSLKTHVSSCKLKIQGHSPTTTKLRVSLLPVPNTFNGTQVYTPSPSTVVLNTPELLLPILVSFKYRWYTAGGFTFVTQRSVKLLVKSIVVFFGLLSMVRFVIFGAAIKLKTGGIYDGNPVQLWLYKMANYYWLINFQNIPVTTILTNKWHFSLGPCIGKLTQKTWSRPCLLGENKIKSR